MTSNGPPPAFLSFVLAFAPALVGISAMTMPDFSRGAAPNNQASAAVSASSPEMEKLRFLVGTWSAADTYEKTPINPNGGQGSGLYKTILGPGGFSLLTDYQYKGPHGESTGHQILTWDAKLGRYAGYLVTSAGPGCTVVSGAWEGPNLVLAGEFEARGKKIAFRLVYSDITDHSMTFRQYNSVDGSPSELFGTTLFTRK